VEIYIEHRRRCHNRDILVYLWKRSEKIDERAITNSSTVLGPQGIQLRCCCREIANGEEVLNTVLNPCLH
jgi:hypothetical protein